MEKESLPPPPLFEQTGEVPPIPPRMLTPGDLPADADGKLVWWKPTWGEIARRLGWSWLFVGPAILLAVGGTGMCIWSWWWAWWWNWHWSVVLLAGVIGGVVGVVRAAIKS